MIYKLLLATGVSFFICSSSHCQEWIRIYNDTVNTYATKIHEHYDKGYILTGKKNEGWSSYGWILKTDINGFKLWSKSYGNQEKLRDFSSSRLTADRGLVTAGSTRTPPSECYDPIIVKLNSCGEKQWCRIYNASGCNSWAKDIELVPGGGYIALIDRWKPGEEERIWLFRLDSLGYVVWAQAYTTDPNFWSERSHSLLQTADSCFIITGEAYYPDPTYPGKSIVKIILIKVNLNGETVFEVPWGINNGIVSDGRLSTIDLKNNIYTAGRRARKTAPFGDSPCLFRTSLLGEPILYKDLKTTSILGIATTINWFNDSSLVQCMYWGSQVGNDTTSVINIDTLGNSIKETPLLSNYGTGSFWASDITYNNRLILGGYLLSSGVFNSCAFKINSDLEYDSIYTTPFIYDSLCPHPIVSDTIPLDDCEVVVVGIDEAEQHPESTQLKVYPNPADGRVTIEMPKYLVRKSSSFVPGSGTSADKASQGITATTTYHQWKEVRMEVFDIFGRLMHCETVPQQTKSVTLNISSWPPGMYVARVVFMDEVVAREKFVVE